MEWTYDEVCGTDDPGQARYFVTAKKDTISVCRGQCNNDTPLQCVLVDDTGTDTDYTLGGPSDGIPGSFIFGDSADNHLIATIGRALIDGAEGDDILEDHNGETSAIG